MESKTGLGEKMQASLAFHTITKALVFPGMRQRHIERLYNAKILDSAMSRSLCHGGRE